MYSDVEVVDMSSGDSVCDKPEEYPIDMEGGVGMIYQDQPVICGGYEYDNRMDSDKCYAYDYENDTW